MKTALVIAGGGALGIGPATFLKDMENDSGQKVYNYFDGFAGTSVGSILAGAYAFGLSAVDVDGLFRKEVGDIFGSTNWRYRLLKCGPKYDDSKVNAFLQKIFDGVTLADPTLRPLFIYAYNRCTRNLKVFTNGDLEPLWYAVRCSMAAPTYFAPVDGTYLDGGMAANNPAVQTLAGMINKHLAAQSEIRIMDLVTSGQTPPQEKLNAGAFVLTSLEQDILPAVTAGNEAAQDYMCNAFLGHNYCRIQPDCPDYDMDDVSKVSAVTAIWQNEWDQNKGDILRWKNGL